MILLFVLFALGVIKLWQKGMQSDLFKLRPAIFIANGKDYSEDAIYEFNRLSGYFAGKSLLEPGLLDKVRQVYSSSPWVEEVCSLRRVYPNKISIEFVPRYAAVQVRHDGYYWLVARDGVLLPADGVKKAYPGLPIIKGDIEKRPENGHIWHSDGVSGALKAFAELNDSDIADELQVSGIEIKAPGFIDRLKRPGKSRPRLLIKTDKNITIMWGTCEGSYPGELRPAEKIFMIRKLLSAWHIKGDMNKNICFDVRTKVAGYNL